MSLFSIPVIAYPHALNLCLLDRFFAVLSGLRSPHKLKSAVSGCVRECAEAQGKDFGLVATENGYNLYVCGNGGAVARCVGLVEMRLVISPTCSCQNTGTMAEMTLIRIRFYSRPVTCYISRKRLQPLLRRNRKWRSQANIKKFRRRHFPPVTDPQFSMKFLDGCQTTRV